MASMLDLMPAPGLIYNEWDKHGTCSGMGARAYFETIRKARAAGEIGEVDEGPLADLIQAMADGVTGLWGMDPKAVDLDGCKKLIRQMLLSVIGGKR